MSDAGLINAFVGGLELPPDWGVSKWADERRYLSAESSAEPGKWNTARTPYLREPMDVMSEEGVEFVTILFPSQSGKSEALFNTIGFHIDLDPCPMMMVQPTVDMAKAVSKDRIAPMLRDSPVLVEKVGEAKAKDGNSTLLQKQFPGGHLTLVGANAPASLASRPIRVVLADEVDRFPASAGDEGDPLMLAVRRTISFRYNRKILVTSTPTLKGISRVEKSYNQSDQRKYFCPCPHCGHEQTLEFENIHYDKENPDGAQLACTDCGTLWSEADRLDAVSKGRWVAQRPQIKNHAGFSMTGLVSPFYTIPGIVKEWLLAEGDPAIERTFYNTVLGQAYQDETDAIDEDSLVARMRGFGLHMIPSEVLLITAGVDVQVDRVEVTYMGFSEKQMWILAHEVIEGDPTGDTLWKDLDEALSRTFQHELGNRIKVEAVAVDSGYETQTVYDFCDARKHRRFYAVKGDDGDKPIWALSKTKIRDNSKLHIVGVDNAKSAILTRLKKANPEAPGHVHLADMGERSVDYVEQLLSEFREIKFVNGYKKHVWHRKPGRRAEALDCAVYAYAARHPLKPNWEQRQKDLTRVEMTEEPQTPDEVRKKARSWSNIANKL